MPLNNEGYNMAKVPNTYKEMTGPLNGFVKLVEDKGINHEGNPVLAWQIGHVAVANGPDEGIRIDKEASQGKVDGPVSLLMAYKGALEWKSEPSPGVY